MDDRKFDALTRAFARGASRRTAIKGLFGGLVGGVAVASRLDRVGAQEYCTPETVLQDCTLPDECYTATCEPFGETHLCVYLGGCGDDHCCGGTCQECCDSGDCYGCDICSNGSCVSTCNDCQVCAGSSCIAKTGGICCEGTWIEGGQCCNTGDCIAPDATFCSSVTCLDYTCTVVPECPDDQQCCGYGAEGAHCAECCDHGDCYLFPCGECQQGSCHYDQCCSSYDCQGACETCGTDGYCHGCGEGYECCGDSCVPYGTCCDGWGEACHYGEVGAGDNQQSCCDGLLCCDTGKGGHACYECCGDWNCDFGLVCSEGQCVECGDDSHCGKGEICCYGQCVYGECCSVVPTGVAGAGLEDAHVCGACEYCDNYWCVSSCDSDEVCCESEPGYHHCVDKHEGCCGLAGDWCVEVGAADGNLNGSCCDGLNCCYDDKSKSGYCSECCGDWDCEGGYCCGGVCQAECCDDKDCEWGVCEGGYCVECRDDYGCGKGKICCDGSCEAWECCGWGDDHCGDCGWCGENYQCYALAEYGEHCEILQAADGSPEGNCCHGLVCCEWDKGNVCAECCGDWDCPKGCECDHGVCSCHCASDHDCAKGTCCCKSGACSHDCCPKPEPKPKPKPKPDAPVTTLPATGSGDTAQSSGLLGVAALGAAAAVFAAKRLRENPSEE